MISTSTDYTGRTVDLLTLQGVDPGKFSSSATLSFGTYGKQVTGVQKLVQKYALMLLTERGSQPDDPTFGTSFLSDLRRGVGSSAVGYVAHYFNFANLDIIRTLVAQSKLTTFDDEKFKEAKLLSSSFNAGVLSLNIQIFTIAGESATFILPIPLNNG